MNYFAHGREHLADPWFLAGTALPDWLSVADRRARVRRPLAERFTDHAEPSLAALARGVVRHHQDDDWFHRSAAFTELRIDLSQLVRSAVPGDESLRPGFLGHILVEILLDATLIEASPERLQHYYARLAALDPEEVSGRVSELLGRPVERLSAFIHGFRESRFLFDYLEDAKLVGRLNQVLARVRLAPLPETFAQTLPEARRRVAVRAAELLACPD